MVDQKKAPANTKRASLKGMKEDLKNEEVLDAETETGFQHMMLTNINKFKKSISETVVNHSRKVEKLHITIACWPMKVLGKTNRFERYASDIDAIQRKTIEHGYYLMRTMTSKVVDIADEILTRTENHLTLSPIR